MKLVLLMIKLITSFIYGVCGQKLAHADHDVTRTCIARLGKPIIFTANGKKVTP